MEDYEALKRCIVCDSDSIKTIDGGADLCRCNRCGHIFVNPRPTQSAIARFYSKEEQYDHWLADEAERERLWKRRAAMMERDKKKGTLLDIGAGIGQFLHCAHKGYTKVYGTELSARAVEIARRRYGITIFHGAIEDIDFKTVAPFDNISMFHVLEHVPYPKVTIARCRNLLADRGILTIAVPNDIDSLWMRVKRPVKTILKVSGNRRFANVGTYGIHKLRLDGSMHELHLSQFTQSVVVKFLENNGFDIVSVSLDPYFVRTGLRKAVSEMYFYSALMVQKVFSINLYDTIWITARKRENR